MNWFNGKQQKIFSGMKWLIKRAALFYLLLFFLSGLLINYKTIDFGVKVRIIDNLMPERFHYLVSVSSDNRSADKKVLEPYIKFYEKIAQYFPEQADAWGMLGFCYFYDGRPQLSRLAYQNAINLKPENFWFFYNLGVVYFREGDLGKARAAFAESLKKDQRSTIEYISSSKIIYRSVIMSAPQLGTEAPQRFTVGFTNSNILFKLCDQILKNFPNIQPQEALQLIRGQYRLNPDQLNLYLF